MQLCHVLDWKEFRDEELFAALVLNLCSWETNRYTWKNVAAARKIDLLLLFLLYLKEIRAGSVKTIFSNINNTFKRFSATAASLSNHALLFLIGIGNLGFPCFILFYFQHLSKIVFSRIFILNFSV